MTRLGLDLRGLPPGEPLVRLLGALSSLGTDEELAALLPDPGPYYAVIADHGCECEDGARGADRVLVIRRRL